MCPTRRRLISVPTLTCRVGEPVESRPRGVGAVTAGALEHRLCELVGHLGHVTSLLQFPFQPPDLSAFLLEFLPELRELRLAAVLFVRDLLQFRDEITRHVLQIRPLEVLQPGGGARVERLFAVELDPPDRLRPVGHQERLPVVGLLDCSAVLGAEDTLDHLRVVVPGESVPTEPVTLCDELLLDVRRALADPDDPQPVFPAAFADLDERPPGVVQPRPLGDVLVTLLDEHQERLLQLLLFDEQLPGRLPDEFVRYVLVEEPGDVEDDRNVLFQREPGELLGVFVTDLDVTLLVGAGVEDLVLLFEPVVLPVAVDDQHGEVVVQQVLDHDRGGVTLPGAGLAGDEPPAGEDLDDRQRDGCPRREIRRPARAGAHVRDGDRLRLLAHHSALDCPEE